MQGERLGNSKSEDVLALCSTILNCYLIQLLETGLLHADPHPGNLMRTPDGKVGAHPWAPWLCVPGCRP